MTRPPMHLPRLFAAVYGSVHCMDSPSLYATLSETHTYTMAWHGMAWHGTAWHGTAWSIMVPPQ